MQFEYGGDGLEPASMEGAEWPVEFERILNSVKVTTHCSLYSLLYKGYVQDVTWCNCSGKA